MLPSIFKMAIKSSTSTSIEKISEIQGEEQEEIEYLKQFKFS